MALTTNLVAYYKLDESSGNASDSTGGGYTLTNSSVTYGSSYGKINNGAHFSSARLSTTSFPAMGTSNFSVSMWMKAVGVPPASLGILFSLGIDSTTGGFIIYRFPAGTPADNSIKASGGSFSGQVVGPVMTNGDSTMHHLTIVYDGTYLNLYFDGSFYAQTAKSDFNITSQNLTMGDLVTATYYANDDIDEVGVWSRALSSGEVTELYAGGAGNQYPFSTNVTVTPSAQAGTFSLGSPTETGDANIAGTAQAGTFAVNSPTIVTEVIATPNMIFGTFSAQSPSVNTPDALATPSAQVGTFSMPTPVTVISDVNDTEIPSAMTAVFSIPAPTVSAQQDATISATTISATFSLPSRIITADKWQNNFTTASGSWNDKY